MSERIALIIAEYDGQGIHRTGTPVDNASAEWLTDRVRSLGEKATIDRFDLNRVDVEQATLRIGSLQVDGVPLFDCTYTGPDGVTGTAGSLGSEAEIGFQMTLPYDGAPGAVAIREARRNGKHKAIVAVTDNRLPASGIALFNAEAFLEPYGPPVIQVAHQHWGAMKAAMESGDTVQVIASATKRQATASNVEVRVAGKDSSLQPLVVMTPRSGWWTCASERGGGIAAWLEILRAFATDQPDRDVIMTANSGHELHHLGLDAFQGRNPTLVHDAYLWIHLGANFAARGSNIRLQYSDEAAANMMTMAREKVKPSIETPIGTRPFGEARNIFDGGGRYVSLLGDNSLFHHPADVWPDAVDLDATTAWTNVIVSLARHVAGGH